MGGKTKFRKSNIPYEIFYDNGIDERYKKDNKIPTCPYWEGAVKLDKKENNLYKLKIPLEYSNDGVEGIDYIKIKRLETFCPHVSKYNIYNYSDLIKILFDKSNKLSGKESLNINVDDEEHFSIFDHSYSNSMKFEINNDNDNEIDFKWFYLNKKIEYHRIWFYNSKY